MENEENDDFEQIETKYKNLLSHLNAQEDGAHEEDEQD